MFEYLDIQAPTNYSGAIIFWLYIAAALYLTTLILKTLYASSSQSRKDGRSSPVLVLLFSVCAFISFVVLSYNMLSVLIKSYIEWADKHNVPTPASITGPNGIIGYKRQELYLWQWSITSTLFNDFAEAIIADPSQYIWTKLELLATDGLACWMGIEGRMRGIPNLWAYFLLLEILPTSFTLNLFYIALLTHPARDSKIVHSIPWSWQMLAGCYFLIFYFLPHTSGTDFLIPGVLLLRAMLLLPLFLPLDAVVEEKSEKEVAGKAVDEKKTVEDLVDDGVLDRGREYLIPGAALIPLLVVTGVIDLGPAFRALNDHPAVSTMGYDFLLCMSSWALWETCTRMIQ